MSPFLLKAIDLDLGIAALANRMCQETIRCLSVQTLHQKVLKMITNVVVKKSKFFFEEGTQHIFTSSFHREAHNTILN